MITGYASGVFDCFHDGHKAFLDKCAIACDSLIIGVDSDDLVRKNKGDSRPIDSFACRLSNVNSYIDCEAFKKDDNNDHILLRVKPNIYFVSKAKMLKPSRLEILDAANISVIAIDYCDAISTTSILKRLCDESLIISVTN